MKNLGGFEAYKNKNAEQAKKRRDQFKKSLGKLSEVKQHQLICESRAKCRKRVEEFRKRKKDQLLMERRLGNLQTQPSSIASIEFHNTYRTEDALRKAVVKTKRGMPPSPSKQKAVIAKLLHALNTNDKQEVVDNSYCTTKEKPSKGLSPNLVEAITEFYQRDDISRVSPNVKDCKRFVNDITGVKEYKQVRHLMFKLSEVRALFVEEYTAGKSMKAYCDSS